MVQTVVARNVLGKQRKPQWCKKQRQKRHHLYPRNNNLQNLGNKNSNAVKQIASI